MMELLEDSVEMVLMSISKLMDTEKKAKDLPKKRIRKRRKETHLHPVPKKIP